MDLESKWHKVYSNVPKKGPKGSRKGPKWFQTGSKNAKNLIKKLRKKSFKSRQLPFFKQLFRVSAGKFSNKKNAVEYQKQIKKKLHISSWILIK